MEATISTNAVNACVAFSPVKHLSLNLNANSMLGSLNSVYYQKNAEFAVGIYNVTKKLVYCLNAGYGFGDYNLSFFQFNDSTSYNLRTYGDFRKYTVQAYIAFSNNPSEPKWFAGLSFKESLFKDRAEIKYSYADDKAIIGSVSNSNFEPCIFYKYYPTRLLNINAQAGLNISYDRTMFWPTQYVFLRIGLGVRL